MEKQKFEDAFRNIFRNAEEEPSSGVWTNIELDLERLEGRKMKKRILFYQLVAAAAVLLAVVSTGLFYYSETNSGKQINNTTIADNNPGNESLPSGERKSETAPNSSMRLDRDNNERSSLDNTQEAAGRNKQSTDVAKSKDEMASGKKSKSALQPHLNQKGSVQGGVALASKNAQAEKEKISLGSEDLTQAMAEESRMEANVGTFSSNHLPKLYQSRPVVLVLPETQIDEGQVLLARLAYEEQLMNQDKTEKNKRDERVWTSLGFAAGSFSHVGGAGDTPKAAGLNSFQDYNTLGNSLSNETSAPGFSYSVGVNVGGKIANRWTLQGGVNYLTQNSSYTSNALIVGDQNFAAAPTIAEVNKSQGLNSRAADFVSTPEYSVNNNIQFFSLPVSAGYLIIDKDFGWQLNTGISTDFFVQNVLTPDNENLSRTTSGRGDDSPYRPYNFSGLIGTEISYRVAERYRVSLNPGFRYPFNSIYKTELGITTTPVTFDVALKFKYIFH